MDLVVSSLIDFDDFSAALTFQNMLHPRTFVLINFSVSLPTRRCFKREFTEAVAIRIWEACWANYLTDYFHLFVCLAIISAYADDVIAQDLRTDEMLLHFSSLGLIESRERERDCLVII